ncbi:hypothetical protein [Brevundimonas sp. SORGH_AS_0993]|uniref:hypothetical protein n=1 Tax=Brevundimonas sp. SORGH_AS_0993 TaxID=3041794 RepID=UPI0027D907BB|nr:hypothetical protein [Brevundimonas sp. SORGH_AS_0993]
MAAVALAATFGAAGFAVAVFAGAALAGAGVFAALGAAALAVFGSTVFAVAGFTALDFGAAFGLEAAVAGFGDAGLDVVGDLAMYSPTPRFDKNAAATGVQHRIATIRHITGV